MNDDLNPYESGALPSQDDLLWSWQSLMLFGYAAHHLAAVTGLVAGTFLNPTMFGWLFPAKRSLLASLLPVLTIPLFDLAVLLEPLSEQTPPGFHGLVFGRSLLLLTAMGAVLFYGFSGNRWIAVFILIATFLVYFSIGAHGVGLRLGK